MLATSLLVATATSAAASSIYWPELEMPAVNSAARLLKEMSFEELSFPKTADEKHRVRSSDIATVDGVKYDTGYKVLARSGDKIGEGTFGMLVDANMKPIIGDDGKERISHGSDFNSLLTKPSGKIVGVTHFESPTPAATYFNTYELDEGTGRLTMTNTEAMDWSAYGGIWVPCAGSVTPWQSHLGSEEYEPDARALYDAARADPNGKEWMDVSNVEDYWVQYFGKSADASNKEVLEGFHPYHYGYPWEAVANDEGKLESAKKHFAMGRLAIELPYVMPDKKTVYITDDGTGVMLGVYKAEEEGDLSCGTLYGARFHQKSAENGGTFEVEWIQVGPKACNDDFEEHVATTVFGDLFETAEWDADAQECPKGYTAINAQAGAECLKLKDGQEKLASRFEFRRYSAMLGVTTEFSKWEGLTFDATRNKIYTAMSEVRYGMEDNQSKGEDDSSYDEAGPNHVRVAYNECGCVYEMDVDTDTYLATSMKALLCGDKDANTDEFNVCNTERISQPDNLTYLPEHDALVIGEDTTVNQNDVMWFYDFKTKSLTRFLSTPYGSETTSPYWYPNIKGFSYLMAVVQHPYGETDEVKVDEPVATGMSNWVGYVGPFAAQPGTIDAVTGEALVESEIDE